MDPFPKTIQYGKYYLYVAIIIFSIFIVTKRKTLAVNLILSFELYYLRPVHVLIIEKQLLVYMQLILNNCFVYDKFQLQSIINREQIKNVKY